MRPLERLAPLLVEELQFGLHFLPASPTLRARLRTKEEVPEQQKKALTEAGNRLTYSPIPATKELLERLTAIHRRLVEKKPQGRVPAETGILMSLVTGAEASLVPFFAGLFDRRIERDKLSVPRRHFAAAGQGMLVRYSGLRAALDVLLDAATSRLDAAEAAIRALELVFQASDGSLSREVAFVTHAYDRLLVELIVGDYGQPHPPASERAEHASELFQT